MSRNVLSVATIFVALALSAPAAAQSAPKGFKLSDEAGDNTLKIGARVQSMYTLGLADSGDLSDSAFSIPRARLVLKGNLWGKEVKYKFQVDFGKGGSVTLKDFYTDLAVGGATIRVGQFFRPFSRQALTSSSKFSLVDRAIVHKGFSAGRDIGLMVHNNYGKSSDFEWAVGLFNGSGYKPHLSGDVVVDPLTGEGEVTGGNFSNVPDVFGPALVVRGGYQQGHFDAFSETDLQKGELRYAVAASLHADLGGLGDPDLDLELDGLLQYHGLSISGAYDYGLVGPGGSYTYRAQGAYLQGAYAIGQHLEPAVRVGWMNEAGKGDAYELVAGLGWFFKGHDLKWVTDVAALTDAGGTDYRLRSQVQLQF